MSYLIAVEGFWAFSNFGLQALATLYMTTTLLLPGHAEHVLGLATYRRILAGGGAPLSPVELASQTYGVMTSVAYALPLLGAIIADRWMGQTRTAALGLLMLTLGMVATVFEPTFLVGIAFLVVGTGLLKCNLMVQIGRLYTPDDPRRTSAFALYLICANVGGFMAPLIAGTLAERVSFQAGFGALAVGMACGLGAYVLGRAHLPPDVRVVTETGARRASISPHDLRIGAVLTLVLVPEILFFGAYQQAFDIFPVWAKAHIERTVLGFTFPVSWFSTLDGVLTIAGAMLAIRLWAWQAKRGKPMSDIARLGVGSVLGVIAFLVLAGGTVLAGTGQTSLWAGLGYFAVSDPAITWIDTVTMALISRAAPASINTTMMGIYTLSVAAGYFLTGVLGRLYEHMTPTAFWLVHAGVMAASVVFVVVCGGPLARFLKAHTDLPAKDEPSPAVADQLA